MPGTVIAIDGPAASGKSSVAKGVAAALCSSKIWALFLSSGHLYRALAWGAEQQGLSGERITDWINTDWGTGLQLTILEEGVELHVFINGEDSTPHLTHFGVSTMASKMAVFPGVRDTVNRIMHVLSEKYDLVIEGRDIGSVVFPDTPYKFYLDASPEERARRRAKEGTVDSVAERDRLDSTRATAPLIIPEGATVIDTTHLTLNEVIEVVLSHLQDVTSSRS